MRFSTLVFASLVGFGTAQSLGGLPECIKGCVPTDLGGCGTGAVECICSDVDLLGNIACCISGCPSDQQSEAVKFANLLCSSYGVEVPNAVNCKKPTGSTTSGAATGAGATTTTKAPAKTTPTNAATQLAGSGLGAGAVVAGLFAML